MGANIMLAHFHYVNKGTRPFKLASDESGRTELRRAANFDDEQLKFVVSTSRLLKEPGRGMSSPTQWYNPKGEKGFCVWCLT